MTLYQAVEMMSRLDNTSIAALLFLMIYFLPAYFLISVILVYALTEKKSKHAYAPEAVWLSLY
ncbi:hypothetical protein O9993_16710 [Vibrio lentus]|nr:hypothetical protein [Vibrio lentus]